MPEPTLTEEITPEELEDFRFRNDVDDPVASRIMRAASTIRDLQRQLAEERERHLEELNMESTRLQAQVVDLQRQLAEERKRHLTGYAETPANAIRAAEEADHAEEA